MKKRQPKWLQPTLATGSMVGLGFPEQVINKKREGHYGMSKSPSKSLTQRTIFVK